MKVSYATRLIDNRFPPYERFLPPLEGVSILVEAGAFADAIKRPADMAGNEERLIAIEWEEEGDLVLVARRPRRRHLWHRDHRHHLPATASAAAGARAGLILKVVRPAGAASWKSGSARSRKAARLRNLDDQEMIAVAPPCDLRRRPPHGAGFRRRTQHERRHSELVVRGEGPARQPPHPHGCHCAEIRAGRPGRRGRIAPTRSSAASGASRIFGRRTTAIWSGAAAARPARWRRAASPYVALEALEPRRSNWYSDNYGEPYEVNRDPAPRHPRRKTAANVRAVPPPAGTTETRECRGKPIHDGDPEKYVWCAAERQPPSCGPLLYPPKN